MSNTCLQLSASRLNRICRMSLLAETILLESLVLLSIRKWFCKACWWKQTSFQGRPSLTAAECREPMPCLCLGRLATVGWAPCHTGCALSLLTPVIHLLPHELSSASRRRLRFRCHRLVLYVLVLSLALPSPPALFSSETFWSISRCWSRCATSHSYHW